MVKETQQAYACTNYYYSNGRDAKTVKSGDFVPGQIWVEFLSFGRILVLITKKKVLNEEHFSYKSWGIEQS